MLNKKIVNSFLILLLGTTITHASPLTEKIKKSNDEILEKSAFKIKDNPFTQKIFSDIVDETISKSNSKISKIIKNKMVNFKDSLQDEYSIKERKLINSLNKEMNKIDELNSKNLNKLKDELKMKMAKKIQEMNNTIDSMEKEKIYYKHKLEELDSKFNGIQNKLVKYISFIDDKLSLKQVKETNLGKLLLSNDYFPIKYVKDFNDKQRIAVVLNNNKEYKINSMITDDCRIVDLTRTNVKIECIDIRGNAYSNILGLRITDPDKDYILNATIKILRNANVDYDEKKTKTVGFTKPNYTTFSDAVKIK